MDYKNPNPTKQIVRIAWCVVVALLPACEDFVQIDPPRTDLVKTTVFSSDATAEAAMVDVYYELSTDGFISGGTTSITYITTYSSDEQINYSITHQTFDENELVPDNPFILTMWSSMYKSIFKANAILEGVAMSQSLSEKMSTQLVGEAKFIRALCHFYLVNLFGDVPWINTTVYQINASKPRIPASEVYQQIIVDLKEAQTTLPDDYAHAANERVRPNSSTATALLARAFLHMGQWENAEAEATKIIDQVLRYSLVADLNLVFRKNNPEAIWQLHTTQRPQEWSSFRVTASGPNTGVLRESFVNNFEAGDARRTAWVRSITNSKGFFYYPGKYKSNNLAEDYSTLFRLAEQFLIRAEARTMQDNISGAQNDLNMVRQRAGLSNTTASDKAAMRDAIEQERITELFTEQGLRWLDLKRTNRATEVLAPIKGNSWQPTDVLYPIPEYEIQNNVAMKNAQNPGY